MFRASIAAGRDGLSIALLCLIAWLAAPVAASDAVILVLGDSLSAGYGIDVREAWPALLQRRLSELGYAYRVENASISGDTTSGGLTRLPRLLERHKPAIVIVALGANDGLRGVAISEAERNFTRIHALVRDAGASMFVLEMKIPTNYGPIYTEKFAELYVRIAELDGVNLVPFFLHDVALDLSLMQADGLHPNANAQSKMLENVWVYLKNEL